MHSLLAIAILKREGHHAEREQVQEGMREEFPEEVFQAKSPEARKPERDYAPFVHASDQLKSLRLTSLSEIVLERFT